MPISAVEYLRLLQNKIESKLGWGDSKDWKNFDFEKLSFEIECKTKVVLSVSTLKRVWGKVKSNHSPAITTLNALAQFVDYSDWRDFMVSECASSSKINEPEGVSRKTSSATAKKKSKPNLMVYVLGLIFIVFSILTFYVTVTKPIEVKPADFKFEANKVLTIGVPNSVIFTYEASNAKSDSVFIAQTWDTRRKIKVPKDGSNHSSIYYYPGYFRSKLIVNNTIVKTHDIQITTDGWLCLVESENQPIYLKKEDTDKDGIIEVNNEILSKYNVPILPNSPLIKFYNQRDFGDLNTSDFIFETTFKNEVNKEVNACQEVQVLIQCADNIIIIPIVSKQCVGDVSLSALGYNVNSNFSDLSKFGADLKEWTDLKVIGEDNVIKFYVNGIEAYSLVYPDDPVNIVGVQYRFKGAGAVKSAKFKNKSGDIVV